MANVHSSQLDVRLLFQCCCIFDAKSTTAFVGKNRRVYDIALSSHAVIPGRDQESDDDGL